jgi:hypothetical protein
MANLFAYQNLGLLTSTVVELAMNYSYNTHPWVPKRVQNKPFQPFSIRVYKSGINILLFFNLILFKKSVYSKRFPAVLFVLLITSSGELKLSRPTYI